MRSMSSVPRGGTCRVQPHIVMMTITPGGEWPKTSGETRLDQLRPGTRQDVPIGRLNEPVRLRKSGLTEVGNTFKFFTCFDQRRMIIHLGGLYLVVSTKLP